MKEIKYPEGTTEDVRQEFERALKRNIEQFRVVCSLIDIDKATRWARFAHLVYPSIMGATFGCSLAVMSCIFLLDVDVAAWETYTQVALSLLYVFSWHYVYITNDDFVFAERLSRVVFMDDTLLEIYASAMSEDEQEVIWALHSPIVKRRRMLRRVGFNG